MNSCRATERLQYRLIHLPQTQTNWAKVNTHIPHNGDRASDIQIKSFMLKQHATNINSSPLYVT